MECEGYFERTHGCFEREGGPEKQTSMPPEEGEKGVTYHTWQWPGNRADATEECALLLPFARSCWLFSYALGTSAAGGTAWCELGAVPSFPVQGGHDPRQAEDLPAVQVPQQVQLVRVLHRMERPAQPHAKLPLPQRVRRAWRPHEGPPVLACPCGAACSDATVLSSSCPTLSVPRRGMTAPKKSASV